MPEVSISAYAMISGMKPEVRAGIFVFATVDNPAVVAALSSEAIAMFKEDEGMSMIIPIEVAEINQLDIDNPMRCITLNVYSALNGVGLTSAVSAALGDKDIPCNMVAAFHHDHVFVPADMCAKALKVLTSLQDQTAQKS